MNKRFPLIIFDLDDTLVDTSDVYWRSRSRFVAELAEEGFEPNVTVELFEQIDAENLRTLGHAPERYRITMEHTAHQLLKRISKVPSPELLKRIRASGDIILTEYPHLITGATDLLQWAARHFQLVLLTRGQEGLQRRKVRHAEIFDYFAKIRVVESKNAETFSSFIEEMDAEADRTWVIGDSIKSDINPGAIAGARCILYVYRHHSYVWSQEHTENAARPHYCAEDLQTARSILEHPEAFKRVRKVGG